MSDQNLVSYEDAASIAGCSIATIYARIRQGKLDPIVVGSGFRQRKMLRREQVESIKPAPMGRPSKTTEA